MDSAQKILRLPKVIETTGISRSSIYAKISHGLFPIPISLGNRSVGWLESEVNDWIKNCINERNTKKEIKHG